MEEKMVASAKIQRIQAAIWLIAIGGLLMATCLVWENIIGDEGIYISFGIGAVIAAYGLIYMFTSKGDDGLFVTNKRVYGKTIFGKRVDIPLDSVSSVGLTFILFGGITVSSSSGKISFFFINNRNEIHSAINKLLIERQNSKKDNVDESANDVVAELKQYKELLDSGIITEQEFNKKKEELLK